MFRLSGWIGVKNNELYLNNGKDYLHLLKWQKNMCIDDIGNSVQATFLITIKDGLI